jgi:hypothetical protein
MLDEKNKVLEIASIIAIAFLLWRIFSRKRSAVLSEQKEPAMTPDEVLAQFADKKLVCDKVIYRPLSPYGPYAANLLGAGWCYRGDGSFLDGREAGFGDKYADEQADVYTKLKQDEAIRNTNKQIIQFRLINSTASKITTKVLDTISNPLPSFNPAPDAPVASAATARTVSSFTANWAAVIGATGYYLDVATDSGFLAYISGFQCKDVGNVLTYNITGLFEDTNYYFRVRAYSSSGTSFNSNIITTITRKTYDDWFLPSKDELNAMHTELYLHGVGGFDVVNYWSSSERNNSEAWLQTFGSGNQPNASKGSNALSRTCRAFTSITSYSLRDNGTAGGLIFWKSGDDYLEAAPSDNDGHRWSNIEVLLIGTTSTAIGTGQANTNAIIGQAGHIDSAAKLCDDLIIIN